MPAMKTCTHEIWMEVPERRAIISLHTEVERLVGESGVQEGLVLVNAMHITASVFINDDEAGLHHDYERWLEALVPFNADTDHGGEADGSEVAAGRCPINAADDLLPTPLDVEVYDDVGCEGVDVLLPNANLIRFPLYGSYEAMNIYVSLSPTGLFITLLKRINLTTSPTANYHHQGLTSGLTYYYQVQAEGAKGALSGRSRVFSGTPYADPVPPNGRININNGFAKSDSPTVLITLEETAGGGHSPPLPRARRRDDADRTS